MPVPQELSSYQALPGNEYLEAFCLDQKIVPEGQRRRQCRVPTIARLTVGTRHCRLLYIIPV